MRLVGISETEGLVVRDRIVNPDCVITGDKTDGLIDFDVAASQCGVPLHGLCMRVDCRAVVTVRGYTGAVDLTVVRRHSPGLDWIPTPRLGGIRSARLFTARCIGFPRFIKVYL